MNFIPPVPVVSEGSITRATVGAYTDVAGAVQSAAVNVLRVSYDLGNLTAPPYALIEAAATNAALHSDDFTNAAWAKEAAGDATAPVVTANAGTAPDGTVTADRIVFARSGLALADSSVIRQAATIAADNAAGSIYLKSNTGAEQKIVIAGVLAGQVITVTADWQRFQIKSACVGPASLALGTRGGPGFELLGSGVPLGGGDLALDVLAWGGQIEAGEAATSRIATAGAAATRAADVVGAGILAASNLAENDTDDAPLWTATAKTVGQRVRRTGTHRVYECAVAHTPADIAADYPENNLAGTTPKWFELRPTNKFAAFDSVYSTQAEGAAGVLLYVLAPVQAAGSLAAYNMDATSMRVRVTVAGVVKYDKTTALRVKNSRGWLDWFTKPIVRRREITVSDLPQYRNAVISVSFVKPSSTAKVGDIIVGRGESLGETQWEPEVRTVDYSRVETNVFGVTKFTPRRAARIVSCDVFVENVYVDEVVRLLTLYKSTPVGWSGGEFGSLDLLGWAQDFRIVLRSPAGSFLNIQIQGLT